MGNVALRTRYLVAVDVPGQVVWVLVGKDSRGRGWLRTGAPETAGTWCVVEQFLEWSHDDGNIREHIVAHGLSLKQAVEYLEC